MSEVKLIAYTQVDIPDLWEDNPSDIMAYCARVSNPSN